MSSIDKWLERALVALGILAFVWVVFAVYDRKAQQVGALSAQVAAEKKLRVELTQRFARDLSRARATADTVTKRIVVYRAARDTLNVTDTVEVREFVRVADSTVNACERLVSTCTVALSKADSLRLSLERENALIRKQIPGRWSRTLTAARWLAVGVGVGVVLGR